MEIEQTIRQIKVGEIDEMEWLKIREAPEDPEAERHALDHLGLSMRVPFPTTPRSPGTPTTPGTTRRPQAATQAAPATLEQFLLDLPVGQLAPIRVIRYPRELNRFGKDYGLVFGYRRWHAAKRQGLPTIQAQVIHLAADEYDNPKVRFWLRLMGFTENMAREPLSRGDYYRAIRWLKEQYETIYPEASKQFAHLRQERNQDGHLKQRKSTAHPSFVNALARTTKKSQATIERHVQIAELIDLDFLDARYSERINQSAALLLTRVPQDVQIAILDQLAHKRQPFTLKNIESAVAKYQNTHPRSAAATTNNGDETPADTLKLRVSGSSNESSELRDNATQHRAPQQSTLPDLDAVRSMTKLCLDLRLRFTWDLGSIHHAFPVFADLASAADTLVSHLQRQKVILQGEPKNKKLKLVKPLDRMHTR